jgi:hypothetical protein
MLCCSCCQRHCSLLLDLPDRPAYLPARPHVCLPRLLLQKPKWGYVSDQVGSTLQFSVKTKVVSLTSCWPGAGLELGAWHKRFRSPRLPASRPARLPPSPALGANRCPLPARSWPPLNLAGGGRGRAGVPGHSPPAELRKHGNV